MISLETVKDIDLKELFRNFMTKPDLYRNVEMVLHVISAGCINRSVESVAESIILKYILLI